MEPINRVVLKEKAKSALKGSFWKIMLVILVGTLLGCNWNGLKCGSPPVHKVLTVTYAYNINKIKKDIIRGMTDAISDNYDADFSYDYDADASLWTNITAILDKLFAEYDLSEEDILKIACNFVAGMLIIWLILYMLYVTMQFLFGSFVGAPVGVGYRRYFMKNRKGQADFSDLFSAFSSNGYMKIVKTMFVTNIQIFAWKLVFFVPGMIKAYQYYFVSYIMAENPDISAKRARQLSKEMTEGHKWQIFLLELSFIGWGLLCILEVIVLAAISCGILAVPGVVLSYPLAGYVMTTFAELYEERREYVLANGLATREELTDF